MAEIRTGGGESNAKKALGRKIIHYGILDEISSRQRSEYAMPAVFAENISEEDFDRMTQEGSEWFDVLRGFKAEYDEQTRQILLIESPGDDHARISFVILNHLIRSHPNGDNNLNGKTALDAYIQSAPNRFKKVTSDGAISPAGVPRLPPGPPNMNRMSRDGARYPPIIIETAWSEGVDHIAEKVRTWWLRGHQNGNPQTAVQHVIVVKVWEVTDPLLGYEGVIIHFDATAANPAPNTPVAIISFGTLPLSAASIGECTIAFPGVAPVGHLYTNGTPLTAAFNFNITIPLADVFGATPVPAGGGPIILNALQFRNDLFK